MSASTGRRKRSAAIPLAASADRSASWRPEKKIVERERSGLDRFLVKCFTLFCAHTLGWSITKRVILTQIKIEQEFSITRLERRKRSVASQQTSEESCDLLGIELLPVFTQGDIRRSMPLIPYGDELGKVLRYVFGEHLADRRRNGSGHPLPVFVSGGQGRREVLPAENPDDADPGVATEGGVSAPGAIAPSRAVASRCSKSVPSRPFATSGRSSNSALSSVVRNLSSSPCPGSAP